ncbi:L,D-transpeptidase family protein [Thiocapsa bogorovii]|uniref:L,D-transpeptidase family protein n=1 Tax=Thiocapsa bogorovii TaxID=521689 RepID=UPI001E54C85F|nr:L,D-transpeptidase family protein [Thiocapsa bogorovii]UHD14709.1 L,D-transpeptidase family protein [Thiocapsa bogorovii]
MFTQTKYTQDRDFAQGNWAYSADPGGASTTPPARALAPLRCCTALLAGLALSGCATLYDSHHIVEEPERADRFVLPDDETEVVGDVRVVVARYEDTLPDFARRYGLGHDEIVAANPGVDPWLPGDGTRVVLPTQYVLPNAPREGVVVNLATLRLFYFPKREEGEPQVVVTHPIGIGREGWRTPLGQMRIIQKTENPTWTPPASIRRERAKRGEQLPAVVAAGPDNPLGDYAMRLSRPQYLLHGTNKPFGIGMRVSHGCIQLYPEDIARLFEEVPIGTKVTVVNQPYLVGTRAGEVYLEAHTPLAEDQKRWKGSLKPMEKAVETKTADGPDIVDWEKAREVALEARGFPVPISIDSPGLEDVVARARRVPRIPPWAEVEDEES